ncbi:DUF4870 family protein [Brevundimonas sp. VNH65]|uniref:DUF4870 family protein n=1 Tax=Brevundimonas sp. VNH65 TaxID=3400917 RepID=UPI003C00575F
MAEPGDPLKPAPEEIEDDLFGDALPEPAAAPEGKDEADDVALSVQASPTRDEPPRTSGEPDHDDLIGFTSAASLGGVACPPDWGRKAEPDLFEPAARPVNRLAALRAETFKTAAATTAIDPTDHLPAAPSIGEGLADRPTAEPAEGAMGLFAVYALLLGAVPTLGASALVALIAVTVRPRPSQPLARSHFDFQKRTVWIAAIAAVLGVVLIAVNIGVPVLFILAVWMLARSAWGLTTLARGASIKKPRQWLIADWAT